MAVVELLQSIGERPFVLSRGYGGRLKGPVRVDGTSHSAADVGDEPLLLAEVAPVIVSRDRVAGARAARDLGATVIVMDDGFQNPALRKDLSLIVVDGHRGIGNGAVFPAGPLRAPLAPQIERTGALLIIGGGVAAEPLAQAVTERRRPVLRARLQADEASLTQLRGRRVFAFAGIGDPERFFGTLRAHGIDVAATESFPDHHVYRDDEIDTLHAAAARAGLTLVTTTKDRARICGIARGPNSASQAAIATFAVKLAFENDAALRDLLVETLVAARQSDDARHPAGRVSPA
jgi:tetraacyldisaccharide 4'-kinase